MTDSCEVTCSACGAPSVHPVERAGTVQQCPHCNAYVDVPSEADDPSGVRFRTESSPAADGDDAIPDEPRDDGAAIVVLCPFCDEHAEFDASLAGTEQSCPHCGEPVDVLGSMADEATRESAVFFRCEWCHRIARVDDEGQTHGCECPHCGEPNDPDQIAEHRLTGGEAERLGLLPDPEAES